MEPSILFEDAELIVVNKPAGMVVHPDGIHDYPALDAWLSGKYGEIFLVHRIDRETSGTVAVARSERAQNFLRAQFKEREVRKVYRSFVYGALKEERGTIERPIGSSRGGLGPRSARAPKGTMREATTTWRLIKNRQGQDSAAYIEVFPKTGRTHQIRVHLAAIGHPVVCDSLYAPGRPAMLGFKRLALHALSLTLLHPSLGEMTFVAPLPPDFVAAEKLL